MNLTKKNRALWLCVLLIAIVTGPFLTARTASESEVKSLSGPGSDAFLKTLTDNERTWLHAHPVICVVQDPGWPPV